MRIDSEPDIYTKERQVMHFERVGMDHMIRLGKVCYREFRPALSEHVHRDCFELVFFEEGQQSYAVGNQLHTVHSRELFLTFPNEPHSSLDFEEKSRFYYLIFYFPRDLEQFMGFSREATAVLRDFLYSLSRRVYPIGPQILGLLDDMLALYFSETPLRAELIQAKAVELFHELLMLKSAASGQADSSAAMEQMLAFIEQRPMQAISLEELARHVSLSVSRVKQLFKEQTGLTPHDYILRARIGLAQDMLRYTDCPITEIAFQLGFSTSQHFATAFRKYTRETPSGYRKTCRNASSPTHRSP